MVEKKREIEDILAEAIGHIDPVSFQEVIAAQLVKVLEEYSIEKLITDALSREVKKLLPEILKDPAILETLRQKAISAVLSCSFEARR